MQRCEGIPTLRGTYSATRTATFARSQSRVGIATDIAADITPAYLTAARTIALHLNDVYRPRSSDVMAQAPGRVASSRPVAPSQGCKQCPSSLHERRHKRIRL